MNPRIQKLADEIEKIKRKITDYQSRLRELEQQKTQLENADIVAMVRGVDIPPDQFAEFVRMFKEKQGGALPDIPVKEKSGAKDKKTETEAGAEENENGTADGQQ